MGFYTKESSPAACAQTCAPESAPPRSSFVESGTRAYNSAIGRWVSRDPLGETEDANLCAFVANNPAGAVDRLGLQETAAGQANEVKTCCCECVDNLNVDIGDDLNIMWKIKINDAFNIHISHNIKINVSVSNPHTDLKLAGARMTWREKSTLELNKGNIEHVPADGKYHKIFNINGGRNWRERTRSCGGLSVIQVTDNPGFSLYADDPFLKGPFSWEHEIEATFASSPKPCPCEYDAWSITIYRTTSWKKPIVINGQDRQKDEANLAQDVTLDALYVILKIPR